MPFSHASESLEGRFVFDEKEAPGLGFLFAKAICLADVRRYHFADVLVRQVLSVTCTRGNLNQLYVVVCSLFK